MANLSEREYRQLKQGVLAFSFWVSVLGIGCITTPKLKTSPCPELQLGSSYDIGQRLRALENNSQRPDTYPTIEGNEYEAYQERLLPRHLDELETSALFDESMFIRPGYGAGRR